MKPETNDAWIEQSLVSIGAKVADALDIARQARALSADAEGLLIQASLELEECYTFMDKSV